MKTIKDSDTISEIHQTREAIAARFGYDLKAVFADALKRQQVQSAHPVSTPAKKLR